MSSTRDLWPRLLGRNHERAALDGIADAARTGRSQVLVLRGEPGIGKTALLDYLVRVADGCEIRRVSGVESEKDLAFAGLHELCRPFTRHIEVLPRPQGAALSAALGLDSAAPADRWLVGLATLTLLTRVTENRPLICAVDDAHWLDAASAQAFEFVARRLTAQSLGMVFAVGDSASPGFLAGLPQLVVPRLGDSEATALIRSAVIGPLDPQVRERILVEARGNPLALLGLPGAANLPGGSWTPALAARVTRVEREYVRQVKQLPAASQQLLLLAAAEPTGDASLVRRAAERLEIAPAAVAVAEDAGLIEMRDRLLFRHPLLRSAAYRVASAPQRRAVHHALAEVTDAEDRRAWHRAHATVRPDEQVAAEVERGAGRALTRGGLPAAAVFLERAAALTPDPGRRAQRSLEAAEAKFRAGAFDDARSLLDDAAAGPVSPLAQARTGLLRAQLMFVAQRGNEALPLLVGAAQRLEELNTELARDAYLDAFCASVFAGRLAGSLGLPDVARAARQAPRPDRQRKGDLLLDGVTAYFTEGASPALGQALAAYRSDEISLDEGLRSLWLAAVLAVELWDVDGWADLCARYLSIARESGALSELPLALNSGLHVHLLLGDASAAAMLVDEAGAVTEAAAEGTLAPYGAVSLAAWQGRPEADDMISASLGDTRSRGEGIGVSLAYWSRAVLCNSQGRYRDALAAAREASAYPCDVGVANWGLIELVEAGVKAGENTIAGEAMERLTAKTATGGTPWAQGIEAYAKALVNHGSRADDLYRTAISALGRAGVRAQLARAHLSYGEWLLGDGRRVAAREQLQIAGDLFTAMGYQAFAERAGQEATAVGGSFRRTEYVDQLTAQQWRIVQLAHQGLTNPEIGAALSVSPRTVEWHLRKIFGKLGIASRRELRAALAQHPPPAADS